MRNSLLKGIIRLLLFGLFSLPFALPAQYYRITRADKEALNALFDMRYDDAVNIIHRQIALEPGNHYHLFVLHYCNVYKVMFNPSQETFDAFDELETYWRDKMDNDEDTSLLYRVVEAEMMLHYGILKIKFGEKFSGLRYAYGAYGRINDLLEQYPGYRPLKKFDALFNVAISNLPPFVQFAVSLFGVSGDHNKGLRTIKEYYNAVKNEEGFGTEAALFVIFANKLNKTPDSGYVFIHSLPDSVLQMQLMRYFEANLAYRTGHNNEAMRLFAGFDTSALQVEFPFYYYLRGKILLKNLDPAAENDFQQFLLYSHGKDYLKEIHYKLGLALLLQNDLSGFRKQRELACDEGDDITERDRETVYDCSLDYLPDRSLTAAKLLLSGGYLGRADSALQAYLSDNQTFLPYRLEYCLLKGNLEMEKGNPQEAVKFLKTVMQEGAGEDYGFAAHAAMLLGKLYEKQKQFQTALLYYEKARDLYQSDFYEYIDDYAKKGIERLAKRETK